MKQGWFITIEGGEGVGKSTLVTGLQERLSAAKLPHLFTREPGGTSLGQQLRQIVLNRDLSKKFLPLTDLFLMCADRVQHLGEVVRPALEKGDIVVSDRYIDSSRVYQGVLSGVPSCSLDSVLQICTNGLVPNLTLLLDCDVATLSRRLVGRKGSEKEKESRFDDVQAHHHQTIRDGFLALAARDKDRFRIINAKQSQVQIVDEAWGYLWELMYDGR